MSPRPRLGTEQFSADQLVLQVSGDVDPSKLNLDAYDEFLRSLTGEREYQREAIETAVIFLCGGEYSSTGELARRSWADSADLQRRYTTAQDLVNALTFPDLMDCSIDLATGTGKSYVLYGIARIALNEGFVDRVLLLCPSLTIEEGLREKFSALSADTDLTDLLPDRPDGTRLPDLVTAQSTIREGQICVENVHATYERTGSSIKDSFENGGGARTLVLSDEAHHVHRGQPRRGEDQALGLWRGFIADPEYGFRYHVGVSGTCWVGNEYFTDVVHRYAIREAMDDGWIKEVFYLKEDDSATDHERFQKLLKLHERNRKTYGLKPLTICVTRDIGEAKKLNDDLIDFLAGELKVGRAAAEPKVLIVTSHRDHQKNLRRLRTVDRADDSVEWIVSVSMLTEGWDVQNVFLIYPHEHRAFDSKLLIAQVLGRGLRKPDLPGGGQGAVRVFNHQRWGPEVEGLVAEIIDKETEIVQRPATREAAPHFELHDLKYDPVPTGTKATKLQAPKDIRKVTLHAQGDRQEDTVFGSFKDPSRTDVLTTLVREKRYPVEEVIKEVRRYLLERDKQHGTTIAKIYPKTRVERLVKKGLSDLGVTNSEVSQENRQIILSTFGSLQQRTTRPGAVLANKPVGFEMKKTNDMRSVRARIGGLTSKTALFYDSKSAGLGTPEDAVALEKAQEMDQQDVAVHLHEIDNSFLFKSPVNVVLTDHMPERRFVRGLFRKSIADTVKSWVKSPDSGFYTIDYSYQGRSGGTKRARFNPDFFLLLKDNSVVVVETKADDDDSPQNVGKLRWARAHFETVNAMLTEAGEKRRYQFHFLSPQDYALFFQHLQDETLDRFTSTLQASLKAG
ncbi:MAG: type restriction enzyme [Gaiellaceae bacterium]|nr:type restriction enzyme [Gaiellaceae bacterium]